MPSQEKLLWRYAAKAFDPNKKISDADFRDLLDTLRYSPSSYGMQPWHFLVIEDPELRATLQSHAFDQPKVTQASHFLVLCARTSFDEDYINESIARFADIRGQDVSELDGYKKMIVGSLEGKSDEDKQMWMEKQVYIALGFLLSACMEKKIDSCPMEGFKRDEFDKILGLKEKGWTAVVCCAVGYRADDDDYADLAKVRWSEDELFKKM